MKAITTSRVILAGLILALLSTVALGDSRKPNVVVMLADDLGWGDVQCNNPDRGKIPTPHIDRFAAQGMRFTDAHSSSSVCSPTRYTLLTGRYHWRTRLQKGIVGVWGEPLIHPDRLTIAGLAKQQGYRTACVGKWHLGWDWPIEAGEKRHFQGLGGKAGGGGKVAIESGPERQAAWKQVFARPIGGGPTTRGFDTYFGTCVPNWPPYCFIENDRTVGVPTEVLPAENMVRNMASLQGPALPDWKLENILPALVDRAETVIADAAHGKTPFLLYLPFTSPHTPLAVNAEWKGRSGLGVYADLVMETDAAVGRVLAALDKAGVTDETLVIFTSDNGCASYIGVPELEGRGHFPSGPFRGYKTSAWEGGHRIPFLVRWPKVVRPGSVCTGLAHHADVLATLADVWDAPLPDNAGEDSLSLLPVLEGEAGARTTAISHSAQGVVAFRNANWKLIAGPDQGARLQLYDLDADPGERKNLEAEHPDRVTEMLGQIETQVATGRTTQGPPQSNDVPVNWKQHLKP